MKKYLLGTLLVCSLGLAACTSNDDEEVSAQSTEHSTVETTEEEPTVTFEDGTTENGEFELSYEDAQIINSPMEDSPGLYVTYKLENKSNENINPFDTIEENISMYQENEKSEVELQGRYDATDALFSMDDTDAYNEQIDKENAVKDDLKPGKETEAVYAYYLDNKDEPVNMQVVVDEETGELSDPYEIKLEDLEEIPSPEGEEGTGTEEETSTEEHEEPEFNENTEQEETFVPEEPGVDSAIAQRYQDAIENQGMSEDEAYDYANAPYIDEDAEEELEDGEYYDYEDEDDFEDPYDGKSEEELEADRKEADEWQEEFEAEQGRGATSGEIQSHWAEMQGWE